jgi:hypothetical protein
MIAPIGCVCEEFKWNHDEDGTGWVRWSAALSLWVLSNYPRSKAIHFCPWCGSRLNTSNKVPA